MLPAAENVNKDLRENCKDVEDRQEDTTQRKR